MRSLTLQILTWIFSRLVPQGEREPLIGDLIEEYTLRANATSSSAALMWYLQQLCASTPPLVWIRLKRVAPVIGVGLLAFGVVLIGNFVITLAITNWASADTIARQLLGLILMIPMVMLVGYLAEGFCRRSALVLGAVMLGVILWMTLSMGSGPPLLYRVAYAVLVPAAAFIGSALRSFRTHS